MSNSTKFIRDSIHGNLPLDPFEIEVLDYPQLQRLRRVKQLGFISLIYPGANHSRFEHSIGTMHLASKLADQLELSKDDKDLVRIAGLLHDAGHGPFSHVSEAVLGVNHEEITAFVIEKTSIHDKLSEKFDTKEIIDIINGEGKLGPIISGDLDMDRMDYLIRDSHYTGVAYGVIDTERIISNLKLERELILDIKGVQAAESALTARYLMYPSVYQHHTTRIINAMFRRCLRDLINQDSLDPKDMYKYDDADMISICRHSEGLSREMMEKIDNRNLLKRAKVLPVNLFEEPEKIFKIEKEDILKAEEEISEDFNLNRDYTILNIAEYPRFEEMKTLVEFGDKLYHLSEISSIVDALNNARFNSSDLCLFVDSEDVEKVRRLKIENYLDLPETTRKYDTIHTDQVRLM
ncbi:MAG: HD domain-containing protein [Methanobrevibacter sp.]|jgi:HD superfamily phosphohydrolase|nr:HD domain-containing protein [Methanobrevibacter sp.]